ncbi:MAG: hypothetical protein WCO94_00910 [Verrucomicrobiota bacterium]
MQNAPIKIFRLALAVIFMVAAPACAFELFPQKKSSDPNALAGRKGGASRARALQQEMMDFSDRYTMAIWQALDGYSRCENDPVKRSAAEHLKVLFSSASMEIAAGRNPAGNLLDMAVFTDLAQSSVRDYWIPKVFGSGADPLLKAQRSLRADLDAILKKTITDEQRKELDRMVSDYRKSNPSSFYVADIRLRDLVAARTAVGQAGGGIPLLADVSRAVGELDAAVEYGERLMFYVERLPRLTTMQTSLALAQTGAAPAVLSLTESARQTSEALDRMPENLTAALAKNSEALGSLLPGIQSSLADSRAIMESIERIQKSTSQDTAAGPWTPESTAAALREVQAAAREIRRTLEQAEKSLSVTNSLPVERLLRDSSQEVRQTIDYASAKVLRVIGIFLAGQLILLLVAARLFRPHSPKPSQQDSKAG